MAARSNRVGRERTDVMECAVWCYGYMASATYSAHMSPTVQPVAAMRSAFGHRDVKRIRRFAGIARHSLDAVRAEPQLVPLPAGTGVELSSGHPA